MYVWTQNDVSLFHKVFVLNIQCGRGVLEQGSCDVIRVGLIFKGENMYAQTAGAGRVMLRSCKDHADVPGHRDPGY